MNNQQVYAFIDSQNLNLGTSKDVFDQYGKNIYRGWKLDFARFRIYLADKYQVDKAFLFIGFVESNKQLYKRLEEWGYEVILKKTVQFEYGLETAVEGNVDTELVLQAMLQYDNYARAILVSGDGDFYCLLEQWAKDGKLLKILVPNRTRYSRLLEDFQPKLAFVSNLEKKLSQKREASHRHRSRQLSSRRDKRSIANMRRKSR